MISHHHRTVFIHIPKCGGQSIEQAFLSDLGLSWELRAPLLLRPNDEPRIGPPRLAHLLARDYARYHYLSAELFQSYYSFAVMREPVARTLSLFNYMKLVDASQRPIDFDTFLFKWLPKQLALSSAPPDQQNAPASSFFFVRPQIDFITADDGDVMVKDVFLLEDIKAAFSEIQAKAGLRNTLEHRNKSVQRVSRHELRPEHLAFMQSAYAADFDFISSLKARTLNAAQVM